MIYDIIIIGGGPSGYTAALYSSRAGFNTLIIEKLVAGGQMALTGEIENYPGFDEGVDGFTLSMKMKQGAEKYGAKSLTDEVVAVDFSEKIKKIITKTNEYLAKIIIISTGAYPRELGVKNEMNYIGKGIHYCAHCDGFFYKKKNVIVVGGGNSALEDAIYLSDICRKVTILHRRDSFRATNIYVDKLKEINNIEVKWNCTIQELIGNERIEGAVVVNLLTKNKEKVNCDAIFVSIGRKPATEFLNNAVDLDESGYIISDESTKTNIDGVFAIGDVRTKPFRQIVTAVSDGAVAASFAEEYFNKNNFKKHKD